MGKAYLIALLSTFMFLDNVCRGQAGTLDPDWGMEGMVLTDFSTDRAYGQSVLVQPDGRVVVVGRRWLSGGNYDIAIARYLPDGGLDDSFGVGGRVTTTGGTWRISSGYGILQPDGKIVVGGVQSSAFCAMRFFSDGTIDNTFGVDGQVSTNITSGFYPEVVRAIALQSDGKILLAGKTASGDDADMVVVRYLPEGTLDADFASEGVWVHQVSPLSDQVFSVVHQPDDKIVVIGSASIGVPPNANSRFAIGRLLQDGTMDSSFGTDGISLIAVGTGHAAASSGLIQLMG